MRMAIAMLVGVSFMPILPRAEAANPYRARVGSNKQAAIGAYGKAAYPRYYWGFHAREFQNAGIPHGDQGMLGSGIQRNPW